jgi:hypothetical protein
VAERVLIVARTRIRGGACVGGLVLNSGRSVRLTEPGSPSGIPFRVGELWDLDYLVPTDLTPPHVEDVIAHQAVSAGRVRDLRAFLLERVCPLEGPPELLFEGLLQATDTGSGYLSAETGVPHASVGFWLPDRPLARVTEGETVRFRYPSRYGVRSLTYVGFDPAPEVLRARTLLRVSLARWWRGPSGMEQPRCYLQLSGWIE